MLARLSGPEAAALPMLVARVAAGDERAFLALAQQLQPSALRLATRTLGDASEAEDAVQAALVKLWRKADGYQPELGSVEGWFARIVINCCLDRRRSMRPVAPLDVVGDPLDDSPGPDGAAEAGDEAQRVRAAVDRLNPRQRAAILLFYGEEQATADVAAALDTTPKAVEGLLARARAELARMLSDMRTRC